MSIQIKKIAFDLIFASLLSLGAVLLFWALDDFKVFNGQEDRLTDLKMLLRTEKVEGTPIVLVWVDDLSVEQYGFRSPTPRKLLAELIQNISSAGAKVIALDFLFLEKHIAEQDEALVSALEQGGTPIVIASPALLEEQNLGQHHNKHIMPALKNHPLVGFSEIKKGSGDIVRWIRVAKSGQELGSFVSQIYSLFKGEDIVISSLPANRIAPGWLRLNFWNEPSNLISSNPAFQNYSAQEVETLAKYTEVFKDKIVLIGSRIEDLGDTFLSPFNTRRNNIQTLFGVEIHALTLEMLLHQRFLYEISESYLHAMLWAALLLVIIGALYLRPTTAVPLFFLVIIGWTAVSSYLFNRDSLMIPIVGPWLALLGTFLFAQSGAIFKGQKQSRFIRSTFKRYVSPEVVETLLKNPDQLELGGELLPVTVIFTDIAGFTTISENRSPAKIVELLNEYFDAMNRPIFDQQGTLDKYIGDAIMVFYGAPLPQPDQADRACRTSLLMQQALEDLNHQWHQYDIEPFTMRVGIHSARVVVGNIGSQTKMNYTVVGDGVNLAARLETANKFFGSKIIVSEDTLAQTNSNFISRELGTIIVKGKSKSIKIYELCGEEGNEYCSLNEDLVKDYAKGLKCFYQQEFDAAKRIFAQLSKQGDQSSKFLFKQCTHMLEDPPGADWDGAIKLSTKG